MSAATMLTRAERSERNKRAHVIRRMLTDADYRRAREAGTGTPWRVFADMYAAISTDDVLATWEIRDGRAVEVGAVQVPAPTPIASRAERQTRRAMPAHVRAARDAYSETRQAWEDRFEAETGRTWAPGLVERARRQEAKNGRNEICDFVEANPAPVFRDFLRATRAQDATLTVENVGA